MRHLWGRAHRCKCANTLSDDSFLQEHSKVNMNAMGDDHVSFSASHLAVSPCQQYLLVSTDGSRIIMFRVKGTFLPNSLAPLHKSVRLSLPDVWTLSFLQIGHKHGISMV